MEGNIQWRARFAGFVRVLARAQASSEPRRGCLRAAQSIGRGHHGTPASSCSRFIWPAPIRQLSAGPGVFKVGVGPISELLIW